MAGEATSFAADAMLGRLARWLRVLGFDTHDDAIADPELVRIAADEDRMLLTRDRLLLRELQPLRALEIEHDAPLAQLRQVVHALELEPPAEMFTRCMLDNAPLRDLPQGEAQALLPEGVRGIGGPVRQCPVCGRVYWLGSHARRMRSALDLTLPGWLPPIISRWPPSSP